MKTSLALLLVLASSAACAQSKDLQACHRITDDNARLACYDALAADAGTAKRSPTATFASSAETFGLEAQVMKTGPDTIESQLIGLVEGWSSKSLFKLANGQVWQVADNSSAVLYLKDPKVTIRRGALGSFVLELEGTNETARVNRLR